MREEVAEPDPDHLDSGALREPDGPKLLCPIVARSDSENRLRAKQTGPSSRSAESNTSYEIICSDFTPENYNSVPTFDHQEPAVFDRSTLKIHAPSSVNRYRMESFDTGDIDDKGQPIKHNHCGDALALCRAVARRAAQLDRPTLWVTLHASSEYDFQHRLHTSKQPADEFRDEVQRLLRRLPNGRDAGLALFVEQPRSRRDRRTTRSTRTCCSRSTRKQQTCVRLSDIHRVRSPVALLSSSKIVTKDDRSIRWLSPATCRKTSRRSATGTRASTACAATSRPARAGTAPRARSGDWPTLTIAGCSCSDQLARSIRAGTSGSRRRCRHDPRR